MKCPPPFVAGTAALRPHETTFAEVLIPRIAGGRVAICLLVTELEVGFSARSTKDFERTREA